MPNSYVSKVRNTVFVFQVMLLQGSLTHKHREAAGRKSCIFPAGAPKGQHPARERQWGIALTERLCVPSWRLRGVQPWNVNMARGNRFMCVICTDRRSGHCIHSWGWANEDYMRGLGKSPSCPLCTSAEWENPPWTSCFGDLYDCIIFWDIVWFALSSLPLISLFLMAPLMQDLGWWQNLLPM